MQNAGAHVVALLATATLLMNGCVRADETQPPAATPIGLTIDGTTVEIRPAPSGGQVSIHSPAGSFKVILPAKSRETITEVVATKWLDDGIAVAVETVNQSSNERAYYWATEDNVRSAIAGAAPGGTGIRGNTRNQRFLTSADDYDLVGIRSSGGDSIYVVLTRHRRPPPKDDVVDGYIYVHNCPGQIPGRLYELRASQQSIDPASIQ